MSYAQLNDSQTILVNGLANYSDFADSVIAMLEQHLIDERAKYPGNTVKFIDDIEITKTVLWSENTIADWDEVYWLADTSVEPQEVFAVRIEAEIDNKVGLKWEFNEPNGKWIFYVAGVRQPGFVDDPFTAMKQPPGQLKHKDTKERKKRKKEKASKKTIFVSPDGNGGGSASNPMNLEEAVVEVADTLKLFGGIYTIDSTLILSFRDNVVAKAHNGYPIIKTNGVHPPRIYVGVNTRIKDLWFGCDKKQETNKEWLHVGGGSTVESCTFFNYTEIVGEGVPRNFYRGNRFVNYGKSILGASLHGIYITTQPSGSIVERNIFINGDGYGVHLWHAPTNVITRNNLFADVSRAHVMQGSGHLTEKNVYWSTPTPNGRIIYYPRNSTFICRDDFFNAGLDADIAPDLEPGAIIDGNYYVESATAHGTNPHTVLVEEIPAMLGKTSDEIDSAVQRIETAFSGTVEDVYSQAASIDRDFAVLSGVLETWGANN
jgi:hypothetical protein